MTTFTERLQSARQLKNEEARLSQVEWDSKKIGQARIEQIKQQENVVFEKFITEVVIPILQDVQVAFLDGGGEIRVVSYQRLSAEVILEWNKKNEMYVYSGHRLSLSVSQEGERIIFQVNRRGNVILHQDKAWLQKLQDHILEAIEANATYFSHDNFPG